MQKVFSSFGIIVSMLTATGVFLHDGRIDSAYSSAMTSARHDAGSAVDANLSANLHTHPERASHFTHHGQKIPAMPPREYKMKKYLQQNFEPKGKHTFDGHYLPLFSLFKSR